MLAIYELGNEVLLRYALDVHHFCGLDWLHRPRDQMVSPQWAICSSTFFYSREYQHHSFQEASAFEFKPRRRVSRFSMRDVENCAGLEAQVSTQNLFESRRAEARHFRFEATTTRASEPGYTDNWVIVCLSERLLLETACGVWQIVERGYRQLPYTCSVFARKFPKESVASTLRAALRCDGGELGYWCWFASSFACVKVDPLQRFW